MKARGYMAVMITAVGLAVSCSAAPELRNDDAIFESPTLYEIA